MLVLFLHLDLFNEKNIIVVVNLQISIVIKLCFEFYEKSIHFLLYITENIIKNTSKLT